jgi:colicin import membrane protein
MSRPRPLQRLADSAGTGLRELPSNAAWLLSRVLPPDTAGPAAATRDTARRIRASVEDVAPVGDSVETRMKRARAAAERAQQAEEEAVAAAEASKQSADRARLVAESNRSQIADLKRELKRRVEESVKEARRAAEVRIERERAAAQAEADEELERRQSEAEAETRDAQHDAEVKQQRAKELVAEAHERLAEARALAGEATQAARAAAEEAHRQAQLLAADAEQQAQAADRRVAAAEEVGKAAAVTGEATSQRLDRRPIDGDLESQTKGELLDLAAAMDIEGRANLTKAELISAIKRASRTPR